MEQEKLDKIINTLQDLKRCIAQIKMDIEIDRKILLKNNIKEKYSEQNLEILNKKEKNIISQNKDNNKNKEIKELQTQILIMEDRIKNNENIIQKLLENKK